MISKLIIFVRLKCSSVSSRKSLHLFSKYQVSRPSLLYHFKSLGIYLGIDYPIFQPFQLSFFSTHYAIIYPLSSMN